ncbi:MAG TPA: ABC transporter ATP-binding protein [Nevskiaceae bacterium]|nr:ABC transporter ATP-binding protein [Nevskiaceae bacterium]
MVAETILSVKNLVKDYDAYRAVDHVSFTIQKGQVLGLLGPNGAGKSTTIQMLMGVTTPTAGTIRYFGTDFSKHRQACLQRINYASAYNWLQQRITVKENLSVFAKLYGLSKPTQKIAELLEYFEIGRLANHRYRQLSAGERTRVNLVKALLNDPELILMDEPTASLDPDIADKTLRLIERLRTERNLSILFTSHNMAEVERICNEVIFLDKGKIVSSDTPHNHTKQLEEVMITIRFGGKQQAVQAVLEEHKASHSFPQSHTATINTVADQVGLLISALGAKGIRMHDIEVQKPTLEDVFLEIARRKQ